MNFAPGPRQLPFLSWCVYFGSLSGLGSCAHIQAGKKTFAPSDFIYRVGMFIRRPPFDFAIGDGLEMVANRLNVPTSLKRLRLDYGPERFGKVDK